MNKRNTLEYKRGLLAWLIVSMLFCYQYIIRMLPSAMSEFLITKLDINSSWYGQFVGVYYISYTIMHIPLGLLYDKFGVKKVITIGALLIVLGTSTTIYSDNFIINFLGRFLSGLGSASATVGVFQIIIITFPKRQFSLYLSFSLFIGLSGAMYAGGYMPSLISKIGEIETIVLLSIIGIIIAIISFFLIPDIKMAKKGSEEFHNLDMIGELKLLFKNYSVFIYPIIGGLLIAPLEGFVDAWANVLYKIKYADEANNSFYLANTLLFFGFISGSIVSGYLVSKIDKLCVPLTFIFSIIMLPTFFVILNIDVSVPTLIVLNYILGISCAYQTLVVHKVSEIAPKEISGLATSFANMVMMIFGYFFHSIIGILVTKNNPNAILTADGIVSSLSVVYYTLILAIVIQIFIMFKSKINK